MQLCLFYFVYSITYTDWGVPPSERKNMDFTGLFELLSKMKGTLLGLNSSLSKIEFYSTGMNCNLFIGSRICTLQNKIILSLKVLTEWVLQTLTLMAWWSAWKCSKSGVEPFEDPLYTE